MKKDEDAAKCCAGFRIYQRIIHSTSWLAAIGQMANSYTAFSKARYKHGLASVTFPDYADF
jgi:hypothetical protein